MAKIQLDAASMLPAAAKSGRTQTADNTVFNRLLKASDRKTANPSKPSKASGNDPGKNPGVSGKDETPVKDSGPKGREEADAGEEGRVSSGENLSVEQFLLLQGALNQPAAAAVPEENLQNPNEVQNVSAEMQPVVPEVTVGVVPETLPEVVPEETVTQIQPEVLPEPLTENAEDFMQENLPNAAEREVLPETAVSEKIGQTEPAVQENLPVPNDKAVEVPTAAEQAAEAEKPTQTQKTEDLSSFVLKNARQDSVEADEQKTAEKVKAVAVEMRAAVEKFQADINHSAGVQMGKQAAAQEENRSQTENGQDTQAQPFWQTGVLQAESRSAFASEVQQTESIPVQTSEANLVSDIARTIADHFPQNNGTLTIELEPASLGKLTIQVLYEGGKATVSILASNPKTLELLSQRATEMASILEEHTGQETIVYTEPPEPRQPYEERQGGGQGREREPEEKEEKKKSEGDSFAQQLRLGLI